MEYIEIKAPAKINFGLNVVSKRNDGYHNIETIFIPVNDLYDVLHFRKSANFSFSSSDSSLSGDDNLIVKAKELLEKHSGKRLDVSIHLEKKIPVGAGMGGGSSDAAAVLLALNDMFALGYSFDKLKEFALELGSDLPLFILPAVYYAEGRGEILTPVDFEIDMPMLIVNPHIHLSTAEAYRNLTAKPSAWSLKQLDGTKFSCNPDIIKHVINDFESYVFDRYPEVEKIKDDMYKSGAKFALMTGSGSTVFGIFENERSAQKAASLLPDDFFKFIQI
jgi:4-diphosphocytidyl-2-C-methyl-D-erythritol kinase